MNAAAAKIDRYSKEGNTQKVEQILTIMRSGTPRIQEELDKKYGPKRLDNEATEATDIANKIRKDILDEIEAV